MTPLHGTRRHGPTRIALAVALACAAPTLLAQTAASQQQTVAAADKAATLDEVVVTAERMDTPLTVVTDPRAPRQPVPAQDGADILKTIPGFSVIRKGGTDGDPVLRGLAGSRLNILLDGEQILGGCGGRMDPPTAYVFPESYDSLRVIKGPQTVQWGPGNAAGTVLFERNWPRWPAAGAKFYGSALVGSFGRNDEMADFQIGNTQAYAKVVGTHTQASDYRDGSGTTVHSKYNRWSGYGAVGLTPDADTRIELSTAASDGEAAYADRGMDGTKFSRQNATLKFEKRNLSPVVQKVEAIAYWNYIDHIMDNYSLRTATGTKMLSNPDRETYGGRAAATLRLGELTQLVLGADHATNIHTLRTAMGNGVYAVGGVPRVEDARFEQTGVFGELTHYLGEKQRLIGGLRSDFWSGTDHFKVNGAPRASYGQTRRDTLTSGFFRYEQDFAAGQTAYAGLGYVERFPDYWELAKQSQNSNSAWNTRPEKTAQFDTGVLWRHGDWDATVAAFYGKTDDYILIQNVGSDMAARTLSRNVDATRYGGEASLGYRFTSSWRSDLTLAWVRGSNDTDDRPLAQTPPLEARWSVGFDNGVWSAGTLTRLVARQDRVAVGQGNIVGQDIGEAGGFAVFSVNAGWKPSKKLRLTAGVDNLFNRTYAEAISRAGAMVAGYGQTTRVNEPGRTGWLKLTIALE